jgi:outer membrane lipoprotein-sorting protein
VFQNKPLQLLYWYVDLPNNQQLYTTLRNVKMNEEMPQGLFTFKSPRFNKGAGAPR